ncbi:MAG: FKBP-type peptidyl-prolyl cis-trans isomerase [Vicinamibacterales bacterium]|nr:FKBP-type peptidyl-prolyl cis-trans isomerase [Vicinamibacterales bacterium]
MLARGVRFAVGCVVCLVLPVFVVGCEDTVTTPTNSAPFSLTDVRVGTGPQAATGSTLSVNYAGWFYDGTKTDQKGVQFTTSTGVGPLEFVLGAGTVIEGWEQGVVGMRVGGLRRLIIPPSMAYGTGRYGVIPGNSTLVFEIELLAIPTAEAVGSR